MHAFQMYAYTTRAFLDCDCNNTFLKFVYCDWGLLVHVRAFIVFLFVPPLSVCVHYASFNDHVIQTS